MRWTLEQNAVAFSLKKKRRRRKKISFNFSIACRNYGKCIVNKDFHRRGGEMKINK